MFRSVCLIWGPRGQEARNSTLGKEGTVSGEYNIHNTKEGGILGVKGISKEGELGKRTENGRITNLRIMRKP